MAPKSNQIPDSMVQGLQTVLSDLAPLALAPDADVQFLQQLQMVIVQKVKQATAQAMQGKQQAMHQMVAGGGQPGGGPQGPPGGGGGGMQGLAGSAQAQGGLGGPGGAPNPDELRRVLGAQGATQ